MTPQNGSISQEEADRLCLAASSLFFTLLLEEAAERGCSVMLPRLLAPRTPLPPPEQLPPAERKEGMDLLIRLGIVQQDEEGRARVPLQIET